MIPSYRRPSDLTRCLVALSRQTRISDEIIVVARTDDHETWGVIHDFTMDLPLKGAAVQEPGVIQAENLGISLASGDIIAFTDDDAEPCVDWLERIVRIFSQANQRLVAVGGRDTIYCDELPDDRCKPVVGKLTWFGRLQGNHEFGCGPARDVDVLKGVNMAFRSTYIRDIGLDTRLQGRGAQMHWELMLCLTARKQGLTLLFDPSIHVKHYPGKRYGRDQRIDFYPETMTENVHNETLAILSYFPWPQRFIFLIWSFLVGHRGAPGLIQAVRLGILGYPSIAMFKAAQKGRIFGWITWRAD